LDLSPMPSRKRRDYPHTVVGSEGNSVDPVVA